MQEKHGNLTTLVRDDMRFCADPVTDFGQKDGSTFEPNKYFARLLKEKSLNGLMAKDNELVAGKWTIFSCICRKGRMITDTCPRRNKRNWWWYEDIGIRELQQVYQCYRHDPQGLNIAVPLKKNHLTDIQQIDEIKCGRHGIWNEASWRKCEQYFETVRRNITSFGPQPRENQKIDNGSQHAETTAVYIRLAESTQSLPRWSSVCASCQILHACHATVRALSTYGRL